MRVLTRGNYVYERSNREKRILSRKVLKGLMGIAVAFEISTEAASATHGAHASEAGCGTGGPPCPLVRT